MANKINNEKRPSLLSLVRNSELAIKLADDLEPVFQWIQKRFAYIICRTTLIIGAGNLLWFVTGALLNFVRALFNQEYFLFTVMIEKVLSIGLVFLVSCFVVMNIFSSIPLDNFITDTDDFSKPDITEFRQMVDNISESREGSRHRSGSWLRTSVLKKNQNVRSKFTKTKRRASRRKAKSCARKRNSTSY